MTTAAGSPQFALYLPRTLLEWQARPDPGRYLEVEGTLLMADVSDFTQLSEQLADKGKEGSEEVTQVLNGAFTELLDVAALDGGDLLKFGGDALLHLFTGQDHAARAARAAFDMRDALEDFQNSPVPLAMSMGVASGTLHLFLAGGSHNELLIAGPTATAAVQMESTAAPGEILLTGSTAEQIDNHSTVGDEKDGGFLLEDAPDSGEFDPVDDAPDGEIEFADFVPVRLRSHLTVRFNEGEHRVANVAFVKLAGLGDLLETSGPAAAGDALDDFVGSVQEAAEHFGVCFLASDLAENGAKLILTTGVPERADAEEERILRAVHDIVRIETPFDVTVGVARGNVFAGDLGSRSRRVYTVMGDTVNLAARLASAAELGTALVTHKIHDRAESLFEVEELSPLSLKGKSKPITPLLLGTVTSGGEARAIDQLALLGRADEMAQLLQAAEATRIGVGKVVDVVGVAGVGKTRLLAELMSVTALPTFSVAAEPYEASTSYFVAGQLVRGVLGIKYTVDADELGAQLKDAIEKQSPSLMQWLPLVARVCAAHVPITPEVEALNDDFQTQKTAEVTVQLLTELVAKPTLLVIDSAEWVDEPSRQIFMAMERVVDERPWLICVGRRPGPGWDQAAAATTIELNGLPLEETRRLVAEASSDIAIPPTRFEAILQRSGGNPFFALELVAAAGDGSGELPESIEAAAAARVDRLQPPDRRFLRYAAVLGQNFTIDLLADSLPEVAAMLEDPDIWDRLSEFLETTSTGTVRFRQPILRDVAYEGLPFGTRRELHGAVGDAVERRARRRPERFAELLSLHFDRAEDYSKSWEFSVMGAERARRKYANIVAAELYGRALGAAEHMEADVPQPERASVAEALGEVTDRTGLHDEAWTAFSQALNLVGDDPLARGRLLRKQGMVKEKLGEYEPAIELLQAALHALDSAPDSLDHSKERLEGMVGIAGVLNRQGNREESAGWCREVIDGTDGDEDPAGLAHAYSLLETNYTDLNHPERGQFYGKALEIYRDLKDLIGEAKVLNNIGYNLYFLGDWQGAAENWERSAEASEKGGDIVTAATAMHNLGELDVDRGLLESARGPLTEALRIWRGTAYPGGIAYANMNLGRLESRAGNRQKAIEHFDASEAAFEAVGSRLGVLEARSRRIGDLLRHRETNAAIKMLEADLEEAEAMGGSINLQTSLRRLLGYAYMQLSDTERARPELDRSLELAVEANARFEEGLTSLALSAWAQAAGVDDQWARPAASIFAELGVADPAHLDISKP